MSFAALETYLLPFKNIFAEEGVNELMINKPGEAWVEKKRRPTLRANTRS